MKKLMAVILGLVLVMLVPVSCAQAPPPAPLPAPAPPLPEVAPPVERVAATIDDIRFEPESTGQTAIGLMSWRNTGDATRDFDVLFYLISLAGARYGPVQVEKDVRVAPQVSTATSVRLNSEGLPPGDYAVLVNVYDAQTDELVTSRTFATILTLEVVGVVVPEETPTPTPSGQVLLWTLVNPPGGGTISPGSGTYPSGPMVYLIATPSPGYRFVSWSGDVPTGLGLSPDVWIPTDQDRTLQANFELISTPTPNQCVLQFVINPPGSGTTSHSSGTYPSGPMIYLIATPSLGYRFVSWSGDVPTGLGLSPDIWIPTDQDRTLQANFELISTPTPTVPTGQISDAAISWGTNPDHVIFTWTATNLNASFEYWVYPDVGFTENSGPFGSTPEDEAARLEGMYDMAVTHFRPAEDGTGAWNWYGGKPSNPTGQLALLAYDPVAGEAYVVDISEEIDTSAW